MCGIAGHIGVSSLADINEAHLSSLMSNRGPDHFGRFSATTDEGECNLFFSRLTILDFDGRSNQPFEFDHLAMVFNGELYNYVELREVLIGEGYSFHTTSDSEVVIKAFHLWGEDAFKRFEGMWAIAIYDKRRKQLVLSRDRFGEKPLFIYRKGRDLFFASEVKFLRPLIKHDLQICRFKLEGYLFQGYKALFKDPTSYFENVIRFTPGTYAVLGPSGQFKVFPFFEVKPESEALDMSTEEAVYGVRARLIESMRKRVRADVPLAFCLSGGVDSAALASIAVKELGQKIHTFSIIDSDQRYNEYDNIKATIDDLGCEHTLIELKPTNFLERLGKLVDYHDGPVGTVSYYIHSFLSEEIHRNGMRLAFSGTGADELLTGYYDHYLLHLGVTHGGQYHQSALKNWQTHIAPNIRNPLLKQSDLFVRNPSYRDHIFDLPDEMRRLFKKEVVSNFSEVQYSQDLLKNRMLNEMFHEVVPLILNEDDLNSMLFSIENRSPYLDTDLFNFCQAIPSQLMIQDGFNKFILRESVKGILNDQVRLCRQKKGFNASLMSLVNFKDQTVRDILLDPESSVFEYFHRDEVEKLMGMESLPNSLNKAMFNFMNVKLFLDRWGL